MRSEAEAPSSSSLDIMQHLQGTAASVAHHIFQSYSSNVKIGLDQLDESVITRSLEPMRSELLEMDVESLLNLDRVDDGAVLRPGTHVRPIHFDILPSLPDGEPDSVRYIHIDEIPEQYSLGIFVLPPFTRIPLHDHPNMVVLSRVLYGDVTVRSYDIINPDRIDSFDWQNADMMNKEPGDLHQHRTEKHWYTNILPAMKEMFSSHLAKTSHEFYTSSDNNQDITHPSNPAAPLRVMENASYRLVAPHISTLFPRTCNVHEFTAGENGAAILDFILPPYDMDNHRDCTYYVKKEIPMSVEMTGHDEAKSDTQGRKLCWLLPIPSPSDFHCVTGHYRHIGSPDTE